MASSVQAQSSGSASSERSSYHIAQPGKVDRLHLKREPIPELKPGQATVKVGALGLNFADLFSVLGLYQAFSESPETIPGLEFSGTITAIHGDSTGSTSGQQLQVGDRVAGVTKFGAFSTHVNLGLPYLRKFPEQWTMEEGAAFPVQALTALYGLQHLGALRPGMCLLIHSAAGGVGLQALKIARHYQCTVLGSVTGESKAQFLREQFQDQARASGPDAAAPMHFVARTSPEEFKKTASEFLAQRNLRGFDIVFDSLQGDYFHCGYDLLSPCGRAILFGAGALTPKVGADASALSSRSLAALTPGNLRGLLGTVVGYLRRPKLDLLKLPGENKSVLGFNLIWLYENLAMFEGLYESLERVKLDAPLVGSTYSFHELPQALEHLQSGRSVGKVVVQVSKTQ